MFRLGWLKQKIKAQEVTEHISKASEELEVEGVKGVYKSFSRAWKDEGGDAQAFDTTCKEFKNTMINHMQGKKFQGKPLVKYNRVKECVQILCLEEYAETSYSTKWSRSVDYKWSNQPKAEIERQEAAGPPVAVPKGKSKGKTKGKKPQGATKLNKKISDSLQVLRNANVITSKANALLSHIQNDDEWARFRADATLSPLKVALKDVGQCLKETYWGKAAVMEPGEFRKYALKTWPKALIERQVESSMLKSTTSKLESEIQVLRDQHAIMSKSVGSGLGG